jgi:cytochrome c-type biogenesis protein CcmH
MRALNLALGVALAVMAALHAVPAHAVQPDEILPDAKLEERARNLSRELRCMVCQNQSIDDSDAPLARDLRLLVRERLKAGDSDNQVMDFLTARYGDFVLLNPPMNAKTFLLWVLPAGLLVVGGIVLLLAMRRRSGVATDSGAPVAALTAEEEKKIAALLESDPRTKA